MVPIAIVAVALMTASKPIANLSAVPFTEVTIKDDFWTPKRQVNRKVSIPHTLAECEQMGRMENFDLVAKGVQSGHKGYVFDDSDVYKSLEAAAYALAETPDKALDAHVDAIIAKIRAAQMPDGYIDTAYQLGRVDQRFTRLADDHELYCAGHLIEAGVAHFQATGKRTLLGIATKFADLLCRTFGEGKRMGYPGHPEAELALFKLWKLTGEKRYFDLAQFFLEKRGSRFFADEKHVPKASFDGTYWLDDVPIRDHKEIKGHAVRAAYLFSGASDLAAATHDESLRQALDRVWRNTVFKRVFVTGGIGPSGSNEGFTVDYDLPNESAYQETCASVAMVLWNHRMGLLEGDAKYWDWVERALYNGFLSGVSASGDMFYYVNPLASDGNHHRQAWFGCACCPPNVTRTLASLGQYIYAKSEDALFVNLYIGGRVKTMVGQQEVELTVKTRYPDEGEVDFTVDRAMSKSLRFRIPEWAGSIAVTLDGTPIVPHIESGYASLDQAWKPGAKIHVSFPFMAHQIAAHPSVKEDTGKLALQRGPIIYCFEEIDQAKPLSDCFVPAGTSFHPSGPSLEGVTPLIGPGSASTHISWRQSLYQPASFVRTELKAVPYFAWDNRGPSRMAIWMPTSAASPVIRGLEAGAEVGLSFKSELCSVDAIRDGKPVNSSSEHPSELFHFWPHKGTKEWVTYSWPEQRNIKGVRLYWFDDTGAGECRPPVSWSVDALVAGKWVSVKLDHPSVDLNKWCEASFAPIQTSALRLNVVLQPGWSVGIHEWAVVSAEEE